ncbi:MAG: helix-turn-helix transcriptional regulator [Slackia sp.]|nr:helix-turn-helix transcriptional regulator [Slackia sp.]
MRFELARERRRAGYATQRAFAEAFGISRRTVEDWERGACCPSLLTAAKVAAFLKCSLDDLVKEG